MVDGDDESDEETAQASSPAAPSELDWRTLLVGEETRARASQARRVTAIPGELLYVVEVDKTRRTGELTVALRTRAPKKGGGSSKDRGASVAMSALENLPDERDRRALPLIQAAAAMGNRTSYDTDYTPGYGERCFPSEAPIPSALAGELMPLLSSTGRLYVRAAAAAALVPAVYDGDPPWDFVLALRRQPDGSGSEISGLLRRGSDSADLSAPLVVTASGWLVFEQSVGRVRHFGAFGILGSLRGHPAVTLPASEEGPFLESLYGLSALPKLDLPEALALREIAGAPQPHLQIAAPDPRSWSPRAAERPVAALSFRYGAVSVAFSDPREAVARIDERRLFRRDRAAETAAAAKLLEAGFQRAPEQFGASSDAGRYDIAQAKLPAAVGLLVAEGWRVEAEGKLYRQAGRLQARRDERDRLVRAPRPRSTSAATRPPCPSSSPRSAAATHDRARRRLDRHAARGVAQEVRPARRPRDGRGRRAPLRPAQVGLLDALLAAEPRDVKVDAVFAKVRDELDRFAGRRARWRRPPASRASCAPTSTRASAGSTSCGGSASAAASPTTWASARPCRCWRCSQRRVARKAKGPSLVVVPRSLVFNWSQEAARVHAHAPRARPHRARARHARATTLSRRRPRSSPPTAPCAATSPRCAQIEFDYVILDEAQAIKNADSRVGQGGAAAARRAPAGADRHADREPPRRALVALRVPQPRHARHRDARSSSTTGAGRSEPRDARVLLSRALRPFILRRTKEQVAPELPEKHEQTILCELEPAQRQLYDELRDALPRQPPRQGSRPKAWARSKIQVLEALLRLRQAACHPGLIDDDAPQRDASAKLDVLLPRLDEVLEEGHKALVFSQFTSFLAIVRARLDAAKIAYEYLDGQTRDRAARVERFQTDPDLPALPHQPQGRRPRPEPDRRRLRLPPRPLVEPRRRGPGHRPRPPHRPDQARLRLPPDRRDTVEEKIPELQQTKRDLADAIINADDSLLRRLDRETLELLLS